METYATQLHYKAFFTLLLVLVLTLSGCGAGPADSASDAGKTQATSNAPVALRVGSVTAVDSMDPHQSISAGARDLLFNVFEGLIKPDRDGNMQPAIAQQFSISDDGRVYSFTLRDGVRFHDGATVTVEDAAYSLRRAIQEIDNQLVHAAFSEIEDIQILDANRIDVTLRGANTEFLPQLTIVAILPAHNDDPEGNPVGTGPYKVTSRTQEQVTLERFEDYWGAPAFLERVEWHILPDMNAVAERLRDGSIDLAFQLPTALLSEIPEDYEVYSGAMNMVQALYLNNSFGPFTNPLVRQALCYATDKRELLDSVFDGYGTPIASAMYPAFGKYYLPELNDRYPVNLALAKELLAQAGYPDGFSFTITVPSNYIQHGDTARNLAEQYARIGLDVAVKEEDWNVWLQDVYFGRQHDATVIAVDATTLSASALLSMYASDAVNNFTNYRSERFDSAYSRAVNTVSDPEKTALFKTCEEILTDEAASVYLQDPANFAVLRKTFTGYAFYPMPAQNLARIREATP